MISPQIPSNETERQAAVERYNILDSLPEDIYDNITALMAHISGTPISLVALLDNDRNFLKSHFGIPLSESPRDLSFCGHAINSDEPIMIVEDARDDQRFYDNPLVTEFSAVFYAGVPLTSFDGYKLGTLCLYDHVPRTLDSVTINALLNMAKQVEALLHQRYQNSVLITTQQQLLERNQELARFAATVSHDIKTPVCTLKLIADVMSTEYSDILDDKGNAWVKRLGGAATSVNKYVDAILNHFTSEELLTNEPETIRLSALLCELKTMVGHQDDVEFQLPVDDPELSVNRAVIMQILVNLLTNAIKYNDKDITRIDIEFSETNTVYEFSITDNGMGIPAARIDSVFDLATTAHDRDCSGRSGTGMGLSTVKKLVDKLGGEISVYSTVNKGSTFKFSLAKKSYPLQFAA